MPAEHPATAAAPTRWGILATGKIAHQFALDLALVPGAELAAAGSRSLESATRFVETHAEAHPGARAHGSYADLVADPDVDVVYIASPHSMHLEHARMAFEAGKHVLCEKPVTLTAADAEEMVRLAREHDRFLMEAMWTACHPVVRALADGLRSGRWGTPRHLHAELGFVVPPDPSSRMLDPALGASALLDMGIYPLTFAHLMLGEAEQVSALGSLTERGIDLDVAMVGRHAGGALATMNASMSSWSSRAAMIATDRGRIDVADFHHPTSATFTPYDAGSSNDETATASVETIVGDEPVLGRGYGNEAAEVQRCLAAGLRESPLVPHAQTLSLMHRLDDVRGQIGVSFPA